MSSDSSPLNIGDRVGRFVLLRRLGGGTSGTVYLAEDTMLGDEVALKLLNPNVREIGLARFKREILLARRVVHAGVCRVFDLHEEDGLLFQTMEFIPGETLEAVLQSQGRLEQGRALRVVRDVAEAVAAAHGIGVLHRDLKPANIILALGRKPTVVDFGSATAASVGRVTQVGRLVGTVRYLAPEILTHKSDASERSDVYALGVILYRCLCGQPASPGNTLQEVTQQATTGPPPPSHRNSEIDAALDGVSLRAVHPDPAKRFATAQSLAHALDALVEITLPRILPPAVEPEAPWDGDIEHTVTSVVNFLSDSDVFRQKTRYTTILFSDMVGITEFFTEHGDAEGCRRIKRHSALLIEQIESFGGTVIKTIGDAIMASFASPHDGVSAAVAMQRAIAKYNIEAPIIEEPVLIRIGVNSGKAIIERKEVFGDTVNVAARISSHAAAEQILIGSKTQQALRGGDLPIHRHASVALEGAADRRIELYRVQWQDPEDNTDELLSQKASAFAVSEPDPVPLPEVSDEPTDPDLQPAQKPAARPRPPLMQPESPIPTGSGRIPHGSRGVRVQQWGLVAPPGEVLPPTETDLHRRHSGPIPETFTERARRARKERTETAGLGHGTNPEIRCDELVAQLEGSLEERGLIRGDAEAVDKLMDTAARLLRDKQTEQAVRFLELACARLDETPIDGALVAAKITRLRRWLSRQGDGRHEDSQVRLTQASQLASAGRYLEANRLLNDVFGTLERSES